MSVGVEMEKIGEDTRAQRLCEINDVQYISTNKTVKSFDHTSV